MCTSRTSPIAPALMYSTILRVSSYEWLVSFAFGLLLEIGVEGDAAHDALHFCQHIALPHGTQEPKSRRHDNCHISIFKLSPNLLLTPSAADGSKPQWTMQCSQRGSLPAP